MNTTPSQPFMVGVTYWPRRSGYTWWERFDRIETGDELRHIADLGCSHVRIMLLWELFQSNPNRVDTRALDAFEQTLQIAADIGLGVIATLFPVTTGGALFLPRWASYPNPLDELEHLSRYGAIEQGAGGGTLVYEYGYHRNEAPEVFQSPRIRAAQDVLISEVVGNFGAHPAMAYWQLGEGLEYVRLPDTSAPIYDWYAALSTRIGQVSNVPVMAVLPARNFAAYNGPRPRSVLARSNVLGIATSPALPLPEANQQPLNPKATQFLYGLAASLAEAPLFMSGIGVASAPEGQTGWVEDVRFGRTTWSYLAHAEEQATLLGETLQTLHRDGARGAILSAYSDYTADQWGFAPLDRSVRERSLGLVDSTGREKPAAAVLRDVARSLRSAGVQPHRPALDVDPERYWRDPRAEIARLWQEFASEQR